MNAFAIIVLTAGAVGMVLLAIFLSRMDAKRYESMSGKPEKEKEKNTEKDK